MPEVDEEQLRLGYVEPYEGESISHYLGRLRRLKANSLPSAYSLGNLAGLSATLARWEKLYFNPFPSSKELEALAKVVHVDKSRLIQMLPLRGKTHQPSPIKLCAVCYTEVPCHRIEWQVKSEKELIGCNRHQLRLLLKCPGCKHPFPIPALWVGGNCQNCSFPFAKMVKFQSLL
jgi:hypothetical protein